MCRIRRMNEAEKCEPDHKERSYICLNEQIVTIGKNDERAFNFKFKHVHTEETTQEQAFEPVKALIENVLDGNNSSVFAYGQTGSGKTYTISGGAFKKNGLVQQTMRYVHERMKGEKFKRFVLKCTMAQIYKSDIVDLFRGDDELITELAIIVEDGKVSL